MTETKSVNLKGHEYLISASLIATSTGVYATPVRFENDGTYDWYFTTLDLTQSAANQTIEGQFEVDGQSLYLDYFADFYPAFSYQHSYISGNGAEIWSAGFSDRYAVPLAAGDLIGPGATGGVWNQNPTIEFAWQSSYGYYNYPYGYYYSYDSGYRGLIPADGSTSYLGVRLSIEGSFHYGWIALSNSAGFISVEAWGYETVAGRAVQAGVPSPGPLALLAAGAAGALRRKRSA